jgi:hypothetical protein
LIFKCVRLRGISHRVPCFQYNLPRRYSIQETVISEKYPLEKEKYGLYIYKSQKESGERTNEDSVDLANKVLHSIKMLQNKLEYHLDQHKNSKVEFLNEYKNKVDMLLSHIDQIISALDAKYELLGKLVNDLEKRPILSFRSEFRALFLTVSYTVAYMANHAANLEKKEIERNLRMINVLITLVQMGVILAKERDTVSKKTLLQGLESDFVNSICYPFSDTLSIQDYETLSKVNINDYFENFGGQYAPMLRIFNNLIVSVIASHNASLTYGPNLQTSVFYVSNLFYILNSRKAAEEASKFFSNVNVESGKKLWTMQERNHLLKALTFITLPDIQISARFKIPFPRTILEKNKSKEELTEDVIKKETNQLNKKQMDAKSMERLEHHEMVGQCSMQEYDFYYEQILRILSSGSFSHSNEITLRIIANNISIPKSNLELVRDFPILSKVMTSIHKFRKMFSEDKAQGINNKKGIIFHCHGGG